MRKSALLVTIIFFFSACSSVSRDMFPQWKDLDSFPREWYSSQLMAAKESPIIIPAEVSTYRFTWLRTFHNPIVVRIECPDHCKISAKALSGAGGYDPGKINKTLTRALSQSEEDNFRQLLSKVNFSPAKSAEDIIGLDGARWILEAASGNTYHALDYWSPNPDRNTDVDAYVALCTYMIHLSGFEIPNNEFY